MGFQIPSFNKTYNDIDWKGPTDGKWTENTKDLPECSKIPPNLGKIDKY